MSNELTIDDFYKFKQANTDILPSLIDFYEKCRQIQMALVKKPVGTDDWKKKEADNWLTTNKKNRDDDEKLYSTMRTLLNKLSDENFIVIKNELQKLNIREEHHLEKLSGLIFDKASIEPKFCVWYAKIAADIAQWADNDTNKCFRKLLIDKCQLTFSNILVIDDTTMNITKEKSRGCVVFIGELYNQDLLPSKIINSCFLTLIMIHTNNITESRIIECFCSMMKTVGAKFCRSSPGAQSLFDSIDNMIATEQLIKKDKFALMDIVDLKNKNKWI